MVKDQVNHTKNRWHSNNDGNSTVYIFSFCLISSILASLTEYFTDQFWIFAVFSLIPQMTASTLLEAVSRSALMDHIPTEHIGKTLGILNMSTSGLSVICPLYGALIFDYFGGYANKGLVSSAHYALLLAIILFLLWPFDSFGYKRQQNKRKIS